MKIVVTGAGGGVARAFLEVARGHDVVAFTHSQLDVGDPRAVAGSVPECDAIVNLAAFTDVDGCELEPERAFRDNTDAVGHLADAARARGAALLHVSTDYVFDGTKGAPYDEEDTPAPLSVYGRSKLAGEELARAVAEHLVVRTGYLFGVGRDHCTRAALALAEGREAGGLIDRTGTPTYVPDLALRLLDLLDARRWGTYHLAGPEATTWHEVLLRVAEIGGFAGRVIAQRSDELALRAPRPANSALTSVRLEAAGVEPLPSLDDALARLVGVLGRGSQGSP